MATQETNVRETNQPWICACVSYVGISETNIYPNDFSFWSNSVLKHVLRSEPTSDCVLTIFKTGYSNTSVYLLCYSLTTYQRSADALLSPLLSGFLFGLLTQTFHLTFRLYWQKCFFLVFHTEYYYIRKNDKASMCGMTCTRDVIAYFSPLYNSFQRSSRRWQLVVPLSRIFRQKAQARANFSVLVAPIRASIFYCILHSFALSFTFFSFKVDHGSSGSSQLVQHWYSHY